MSTRAQKLASTPSTMPAHGEALTSTPAPCRVLVTSAWFEPGYRGGGPIRSVAAIVDTVSDGVELVLVTSDRDLGDVAPYADVPAGMSRRGRTRVHRLDVSSVWAWWRLLLDLRAQRFDLVYVNSLWDPRFSLLFIAAVTMRLLHADNILIAPRGELTPGALSLKSRKKLTVLHLLKPVLQRRRVQWHASTADEANQIGGIFPAAEILVVPPQTSLPSRALPPPASHHGSVSLVFLSRISPKKNLDLVLSALEGVTRPIRLDVYGPVEDADYWQRCLGRIELLPAHVNVAYRGEVRPENVRSTFSRYDAFIFPTLGENFGHVIAESLSAACPVVCSRETPWTAVLERGGGAVLRELCVDELTAEINRLAGMGRTERQSVRQAAGDAYDRWRQYTDEANVLGEWVRRHAGSQSVEEGCGTASAPSMGVSHD